MDPLAFLHARQTPHCDAQVDKQFDYWTLQFMTRGRVALRYDDEAFELSGCWVWPAHPGPLIRFHPATEGGDWHHRYVAFTGPRVASWKAAGLLLDRPAEVPPDLEGSLTERFDRVIALAGEAGYWPRLRGANLLEGILIDLAAARAAVEADREPWLEDVLEQLRDLSAEPDYDQLAAGHAMSRSTLGRRFREAMGVPLHTYRLQCRISRACEMLGDGGQPIKQVAAELGYRDVYFFSRQFKQLTTVTPGAYRASRQG